MVENVAPTLNKKDRVIWLDVARVFAIISISMNHAIYRTLSVDSNIALAGKEGLNLDAIIEVALYLFSRMGVPVFLMITGALILNKKFETYEDVKKFYKHNYLGILITSEIWLLIMYWVIVLTKIPGYEEIHGFGHKIEYMIRTMLFDQTYTYGNLWYIPVILGLYTVLPFVSLGIQKLSVRAFAVPTVLVLVSAMLIPNINDILESIGYSGLINFYISYTNIFSVYLPYVIIGYLINNKYMERFKSQVLIVSLAVIFALYIMYTIWYGQHKSYYDISYYHIPTVLISLLAFELIRRFGNEIKHCRKTVTYISRISFAIYFVHIIVMEFIRFNIGEFAHSGIINLVLYEGLSVGISVAFIYVLSYIKPIKKYVFMIK